MIEQFEDREVATQILDSDYFLLCLSGQNFVARPITAQTLKVWIANQLGASSERLVIRSTDPPPSSYRGIWAEPNNNNPDKFWTRQPGTNNWVSLTLYPFSLTAFNVSNDSTLYFPGYAPGNAVYIQDLFLSGQALNDDFSPSAFWTFSYSAKAGDVETPIATVVVDEGAEDDVFRVEASVEISIPASQLQILKLRADKTGRGPRLRNLVAGLRLREVRS